MQDNGEEHILLPINVNQCKNQVDHYYWNLQSLLIIKSMIFNWNYYKFIQYYSFLGIILKIIGKILYEQ